MKKIRKKVLNMGLESTITQFKDNMNKDEKLANLTSEQKK